jgi:hypothetical protein
MEVEMYFKHCEQRKLVDTFFFNGFIYTVINILIQNNGNDRLLTTNDFFHQVNAYKYPHEHQAFLNQWTTHFDVQRVQKHETQERNWKQIKSGIWYRCEIDMDGVFLNNNPLSQFVIVSLKKQLPNNYYSDLDTDIRNSFDNMDIPFSLSDPYKMRIFKKHHSQESEYLYSILIFFTDSNEFELRNYIADLDEPDIS